MAARPLAKYRAKRDFSRTREPAGGRVRPRRGSSRYVIQKHDARRLHFDLRLEVDGVFRSWALPRGPSFDPQEKRLAVEVEDHPLEYGEFEGTIPKGEYGGGTVQLWDKGVWAPVAGETPREALKRGRLKFVAAGRRLAGGWNLVRMRRRGNEKKDNWLLIKEKDPEARPGAGSDVADIDESVKTGRSLAEIAAGRPAKGGKRITGPQVWHSNRAQEEAGDGKPKPARRARKRLRDTPVSLPAFIPPQLAVSVEHPPVGDGWGHEVKFDGYRLQLNNHAGDVTVMTRSGLDWTAKFPEIAEAMRRFEDTIIDGEAVAFNQGNVPDFGSLQAALSAGKTDKLVFYAFDILFLRGVDLRERPLKERKAELLRLLGTSYAPIAYVEHFTTAGDAVLKSACSMALEGVVSKRLDAPYRSGRGDSWQKTKCRGRQEFVIGGFAPSKQHKHGLGALLVGTIQDGALQYSGKVGTGYGESVVARLLPQLKRLKRATSPFSGRQPGKVKDVQWVEPKLIAEVAFASWTQDGLLRQASFKGLRDDKTPAEVTAAREPIARPLRASGPAQVLGVTISNPGKVLWPRDGLTKLGLAEYLATVTERMVWFLKNRPVSIIRAPDGISTSGDKRETFYQRHAGPGTSSLIQRITLPGEPKPYISIGDGPGLIAAAQMGAVEFHPWGCTAADLMHPDQVTFDLDPAPDVEFARVVEAAKELRERLEALGLATYPKTTGGKGLHVVVPLKPKADWAEAKAFAKAVCQAMAADSPDHYLLNMAKKLRHGRIFLDYLRNDLTASAVSAWSPRARDGAPIAVPLGWNAVTRALNPQAFAIETVKAALKRADLWADFDKNRVPLSATLAKKAAA